MDRMGHDSARAALIYQHKTVAAGRAIADALSVQIESLDRPDSHRPGTRLWHVNGTPSRFHDRVRDVWAGGRNWVRTSDPSLVRRVLYP